MIVGHHCMDKAIHQVVIATTMSPHLGLCSSGDLLDLMHSFFVCQEIKHPDLLAITHGGTPKNPDDYAKILDIFDGTDDTTVLAARERWKQYQALGYALNKHDM